MKSEWEKRYNINGPFEIRDWVVTFILLFIVIAIIVTQVITT